MTFAASQTSNFTVNLSVMITIESLKKSYIDYVLTEGAQPKSVYLFAKKNDISEEEFYRYFGSFEALEQTIWADFAKETITEIKTQETWTTYSAREKALSFFYGFFEHLKSGRSFAVYSLRQQHHGLGTPRVLDELKEIVDNFSNDILTEGLESGELTDRKFFAKRYKDALWIQFGFVLNFWINDNSTGFEKTDEAIERGINVTFDLFQRSPIDNLFEYGKFLVNNGGFKDRMGFGSFR